MPYLLFQSVNESHQQMKKPFINYVINLLLLFSGSVMAFSGLLIQIVYHMGNHGGEDTDHTTLGINYSGWSDIHKFSIIFVTLFMIFHTILHWKWYKTIIMKRLFARNKQVTALSAVFILTALTGYIPWFIHLTGGEDTTRKIFIEIHDKLALFLFVYLILHVAKRLKWFNPSRAG
jgi:hypothetical protein